MKTYLSVARGTSPSEAHEIFFSDDIELIDLVVACLLARLDGGTVGTAPDIAPAIAAH